MMLPAHRKLLEDMREDLARGAPRLSDEPEWRVPVDHYVAVERFEREREMMKRLPIVVAHESELAEPATAMAVNVLGVPAIVARGRDRRLRAFLNACRHRATQLLDEAAPCKRKSFVCPYHGWTYDLCGKLLHIPHQDAFPGLEERDLVELPVSAAHGLVWLGHTPGTPCEVGALLGPLAEDLALFDIADHVVFRRTSTTVRANWKLLVEAFLENYHVRQLHRSTVYRFFFDAVGAYEVVGPHIRALSARRALGEHIDVADAAELRLLASPSYYLFPNTIVVIHPDYVSHLGILPEAPDRLRCVHTMLVPRERSGSADREHWEKSFALIDGGVFRSEDFVIVEKMQAGIATGANRHLTFGRLEQTVRWFHQALDAALSA